MLAYTLLRSWESTTDREPPNEKLWWEGKFGSGFNTHDDQTKHVHIQVTQKRKNKVS